MPKIVVILTGMLLNVGKDFTKIDLLIVIQGLLSVKAPGFCEFLRVSKYLFAKVNIFKTFMAAKNDKNSQQANNTRMMVIAITINYTMILFITCMLNYMLE